MSAYLTRSWPGWLIVAAMFAVAIHVWPSAPARIPTHWNGAGAVDRYGGKFEGLLLIPIIATVLWALICTAPFVRPGQTAASVRRALVFLAYAVLLVFVDVFATMVLWISGVVVNMNYVLWPSLVLMYAALGNLVLRAFRNRRGTSQSIDSPTGVTR